MNNQIILGQLFTAAKSSSSKQTMSINEDKASIPFSELLPKNPKNTRTQNIKDIQDNQENETLDFATIEYLSSLLTNSVSINFDTTKFKLSSSKIVNSDLFKFSNQQLNNVKKINSIASINFDNLFSYIQKQLNLTTDDTGAAFIKMQNMNASDIANRTLSAPTTNNLSKNSAKLDIANVLMSTRNFFNPTENASFDDLEVLDNLKLDEGSNLNSLLKFISMNFDELQETQQYASKKSTIEFHAGSKKSTIDFSQFAQQNINITNPSLTIATTDLDLVNHVSEQIDWDTILNKQNIEIDSTMKQVNDRISQDDINSDINMSSVNNSDKFSSMVGNKTPNTLNLFLREHIYSSEWANEIRKNIMNFATSGITRAELKLNPQELGSINIQLQMNDKNLATIHVITPNSFIKTLFESSIDGLKQSLSNEGINLGESFVSTEDSSNNKYEQAKLGSQRVLSNSDEQDDDTSKLEDVAAGVELLNKQNHSSGVDAFV